MFNRRPLILATLFCFLLSAGWSTRGFADMVLIGTAFKNFFIFPIVTVSLYIADRNLKEDILADIPKRLDVHYHVNVSKQELAWQTIKGIERNYSQEQIMALMPKINQIDSYYPDIKAGDCVSVSYIPGTGTRVQVNGYVKGLIPGSDFAKAFFSIWVGKNPVDEKAKFKLLGKEKTGSDA